MQGEGRGCREGRERRQKAGVSNLYLPYANCFFLNAAASVFYSPQLYSNYILKQATFLSCRMRTKICVCAICLISIFGVLFHISAQHLFCNRSYIITLKHTIDHKLRILTLDSLHPPNPRFCMKCVWK